MRVTIDTEANALYVYVREGTFHRTETINKFGHEGGLINVDRNEAGQVLGIEFVPPTTIKIDDITGQTDPEAT